MFDIGFSELLVIGIVALVVIGPEKLPRVARTVGHLLGRAQRYVNDVKADINREMQLDELKRLQAQVAESARSMESSIRQEIDAVALPAQQAVAELEATAKSMTVVQDAADAAAPASTTAAVSSPAASVPAQPTQSS